MEKDFIIIGGGSAGCVLANRLSADGRHQVLLVEAGPSDRRFDIDVPVGYARTFFDPRVNWMYDSAPVPSLDNRVIYYPRGKVLGGSGSINASPRRIRWMNSRIPPAWCSAAARVRPTIGARAATR